MITKKKKKFELWSNVPKRKNNWVSIKNVKIVIKKAFN